LGSRRGGAHADSGSMDGGLRSGVILHWQLHAPHALALQSTGALCTCLRAPSEHLLPARLTGTPCGLHAHAPCMGGVAAPWPGWSLSGGPFGGVVPLSILHLPFLSGPAFSVDSAAVATTCDFRAPSRPPSRLPGLAGTAFRDSDFRGRLAAAGIAAGALSVRWPGGMGKHTGWGCVLPIGRGCSAALSSTLGVPPRERHAPRLIDVLSL
jgi:hypothetical protein